MDQYRQLSERWTREILLRCSPKEIVVLVAAFGAKQIANRMGVDISKLVGQQ